MKVRFSAALAFHRQAFCFLRKICERKIRLDKLRSFISKNRNQKKKSGN